MSLVSATVHMRLSLSTDAILRNVVSRFYTRAKLLDEDKERSGGYDETSTVCNRWCSGGAQLVTLRCKTYVKCEVFITSACHLMDVMKNEGLRWVPVYRTLSTRTVVYCGPRSRFHMRTCDGTRDTGQLGT